MRELKNQIRRTKLKTLILVVTALTITFPVAAQQGDIVLPTRKLNAEELFENIQKQTVYTVAANSRQTAGLSVNVTRATTPIKTVLERLLDGSGMTYRVDGNFIIIVRAPAQDNNTINVNMPRNVVGTVTDYNGNPLEGVIVELVNLPGKRAATHANGRFMIGGVPSGRYISKLTSADGQNIRYREINVPGEKDADVALMFNEELLAMISAQSGSAAAAQTPAPVKTTAYFVPNTSDHTIRAFTDEPKTEYSFIPASQIGSRRYMPKSAIKTNLMYLATTTLNIGAEFGLAKKWTFDVTAGLNPWDLNSRDGGIRHWLVQPEVRYWFCQRFEKHFIGLHGIGGKYQIMDIDLAPFGNDLTGKRYDGYGIGGGVSYGYHLPMSKRWSWEFTVGAGYIYLDYDKYNCGECDNLVGSRQKHYFGLTKAGVSLIFMIK